MFGFENQNDLGNMGEVEWLAGLEKSRGAAHFHIVQMAYAHAIFISLHFLVP